MNRLATLAIANLLVVISFNNPLLAQAPIVGQTPKADRSPGSISSIRIEPDTRKSGAWTNDRMREATPMPLPVIDPRAVRAQAEQRDVTPKPKGATEEMIIAPRSNGYSSGDPGSFPLRWAGKLFFEQPEKMVCSGQFISSNVILTAAHCVRNENTGEYYGNFQFALQYQGGESSQSYGAKCVTTFDGWVQSSEAKWAWDYAMLLSDRDSSTGWFGTTWGWNGSHDNARKIGYPRDILAGEVIQVEEGPISVDERNIVELRHGNRKNREGSSGGAFVANYDTSSEIDTQSNRVISIMSFINEETPGVGYGPYFNDNFKVLFDHIKRGC